MTAHLLSHTEQLCRRQLQREFTALPVLLLSSLLPSTIACLACELPMDIVSLPPAVNRAHSAASPPPSPSSGFILVMFSDAHTSSFSLCHRRWLRYLLPPLPDSKSLQNNGLGSSSFPSSQHSASHTAAPKHLLKELTPARVFSKLVCRAIFGLISSLSCSFAQYLQLILGWFCPWVGEMAIQNTGCFCGGPEFGSQHPHCGPQPSRTPLPGGLMPASDPLRHGMHLVQQRHTCGHMLMNKNKDISLKGGWGIKSSETSFTTLPCVRCKSIHLPHPHNLLSYHLH